MKKNILTYLIALAPLALSCSHQDPTLKISLSDKFEGQTVDIVNFLDSTTIASGVVKNGTVEISGFPDEDVFSAVMIDGRTRAFYITEPGNATLSDSLSTAAGTPLNDRFSYLLSRLDSIENLNDTRAYLDYAEQCYADNKDNPLGNYFGIEIIKYAGIGRIDSLLADASPELKDSPKTRHYVDFARLRSVTAPGQPFLDFEGESIEGDTIAFSSLLKPGYYTLVDFWASWCPYCIKELPDMAALYDKWKDRGLEIIGVAVRDTPDDSKAAINKHNITWPVILNTQKKPYDIYGFSGIPHHILIDPDGKIVSRDESLNQIDQRLKQTLK